MTASSEETLTVAQDDPVAANIAEDEQRGPDGPPSRPQDAEPAPVEVVEPAPEPQAEAADEIDVLDPPPDRYKMTDGTVVVFDRLRTRQFFKLLRIVTHGAVDTIGFLRMDPGMSNEEFVSRLLAVILFAIPDAEDETLEFLRSMVRPEEPHVPDDTPPSEVGKRAVAMRAVAQRQLDQAFADPELDDTLGLVEAIVRREAPDLKALGKRLGTMIQLARKTGQIPEPGQTGPSSEASPEPST